MAKRRSSQLSLFGRRGLRKGIKRSRSGKKFRRHEPHARRPEISPRHPIHVVLRVAEEIGCLRKRRMYHAFRLATHAAARREDFRIVHISIQRTHVHLLVEAEIKRALSNGMRGFEISAAKQVNRVIWNGRRRRGTVFPERYFAESITSPTQARHALAYVLGNWRRHGEDRNAKLRGWKIDWFSSAVMFPGWAEYGDSPWMWRGPATYEPLIVFRPRTWLLREGWKRASATLSCFEVPAARR